MKQTSDGVEYYNSGAWVDAKPTYITIDREGVQIHEYNERNTEGNERIDGRDSSEERSEDDSATALFADETGLYPDAEYEGARR